MSTSEANETAWRPDAIDRYQLAQSYMLFAAGVSVVNNPQNFYEIHGRDVYVQEQAADVLDHAKTITWAGLSDIIRYSSKPEYRSRLDRVEYLFESTFPVMTSAVSEAIEDEYERLHELNPLIAATKPLPVANESVYKYVSRGRKGKLRLHRAIEPFAVHESFGENAGQQTFSGVETQTR